MRKKNVGLVTFVPVTVAEREHEPGATAVVIHPLNNIVLNPPVNIEGSLQQDFPHFSSLVELDDKYFLPTSKREKGMRFFF